MRVIAGTARSLPLRTPEGMGTRPTTDRIKETLFNMLQPYVPGSVFVDLFSGSGAIGIEALSRGAKSAYFAENDRRVCAYIRENLNFTKLADRATVFTQDAVNAVEQIHEKEIDLIFMDPPYGRDLERQVLKQLQNKSSVTENTLIVVEALLDTDFSYLEELGFFTVKEKQYKTNKHVFIRRKA